MTSRGTIAAAGLVALTLSACQPASNAGTTATGSGAVTQAVEAAGLPDAASGAAPIPPEKTPR